MATSKANKAQPVRKKIKSMIANGKVFINATFNNTIVTVTDLEGNVLNWATAGMNFKGARKSTPFAAQVAANKVCEYVKNTFKMKSVDVYVKGPGPGRDGAARALDKFFKVTSISDVTGIPHNGCRPQKERRV